MEILDKFNDLRQQIFNYFGYKEDWVVIPIEDRRDMYWQLRQEQSGSGSVLYWNEPLTNESVEAGEHYEDVIYTQRFLPKWVYRGKDYTMICVDTRTDGNRFLAIYDNNKEQSNVTAEFNPFEGFK